MSSEKFLTDLDNRLRCGWVHLAPTLRDAVIKTVASFGCDGGGCAGRRGMADPYYTDFALRLLHLADGPDSDFEHAGAYLRSLPPAGDLVDLFSRLNAARLLELRGHRIPRPDNVADLLKSQRAGDEGFAHRGVGATSAYITFLAALIFEIMDDPFPEPTTTVAALRRLKRPDGGFADQAGNAPSQASTTAAALVTLGKLGALDKTEAADAARFLTRLQADAGGVRAHLDAPEPDLLSTFTAITALSHLGALDGLRLAAAGRFVLDRRMPDGFCGSATDAEADVEYTYYGVGSLCLLQCHLI